MPGIRYQIFVIHIAGPLSPSFSLLFSSFHPPSLPPPPPATYRAPRRALRHDSRMCFVCTTACNVWAPRYLSYGCGRRSRTGCTLHSTEPRRSLRRLIMVILSRRCKLRRAGARRLRSRAALVRLVRSKRFAQTDYCNNYETIGLSLSLSYTYTSAQQRNIIARLASIVARPFLHLSSFSVSFSLIHSQCFISLKLVSTQALNRGVVSSSFAPFIFRDPALLSRDSVMTRRNLCNDEPLAF